MTTHLLMLPPEVRHRILEFAVHHDEISVCHANIPYTASNHLKNVRNPNTNLWLVCSQVTEGLKAITAPKPTLRCCRLWCARELFKANVVGWKARIECFKRHFTAVNLKSEFRSEQELKRFLDGTVRGFFWFETTYAIKGNIGDPDGVDVTFYPA